jgi:hypothetical protein
MQTTVHELLTSIQYHYLNQWEIQHLPGHTPDLCHAASIIHTLESQLRNTFSPTNHTIAGIEFNSMTLCQFLTFRQECIITHWPASTATDPHSVAWYNYDKLLMIGINYLYMKLILYYNDPRNNIKCPSLISLAAPEANPIINSTNKGIIHPKEFCWLNKMQKMICTLPWRVEKERLEQAMKVHPITDHKTSMIIQLASYLLQLFPQTRLEEQVLTNLLALINNNIVKDHDATQLTELHRELVLELVHPPLPYRKWMAHLISQYTTTCQSVFNSQQLQEELLLWRHQSTNHPQSWVLKLTLSQLENLYQSLNEATAPHKPLLTWNTGVHEFIRCFHPLILKGKIQNNGNSDLVPIVTKLHQVFNIPKTRGIGLVSCPSLLTYFKNANADPSY